MKNTIFWDMTFGGIYFLRLQGGRLSQSGNQQEANTENRSAGCLCSSTLKVEVVHCFETPATYRTAWGNIAGSSIEHSTYECSVNCSFRVSRLKFCAHFSFQGVLCRKSIDIRWRTFYCAFSITEQEVIVKVNLWRGNELEAGLFIHS
jgi:hypothetical protein